MSADLPTFIVVGAMKAGTTSLYHYLRGHDQIFMPKVKELDFFVEEMNWSRGLSWYRQQFESAPDSAVALGEASTVYTKFPRYRGVPERIAGVVPDVRLVYVVRDPIERIRSHYQHRVVMGAETSPPETALFENPIYVDYSRYALQLAQYLEHFPLEQLLVIPSESLRSDRASTVRRIYEFLGVAPDVMPPALETEFYKTDQRRTYPPVVWSARQLMKRRFPQAKRAKELVDSLGATRRRRPAATPSGSGPPETGSTRPDAFTFTSSVRDRLSEHLCDDVAELRRYMHPDFDGWGIA